MLCVSTLNWGVASPQRWEARTRAAAPKQGAQGFPSPQLECQSLSRVRLCNPVDCTVHGILQARILEWDLPNPGIELGSPALQADSLPAEPPGKPVLQLPPTKFDQVVSSRRKRPARDACHTSAPRTGPYPRVSPVPVRCPRGGICVPALAS